MYKTSSSTGLYPATRRIEQDAVSDETWRPLPPRPAPEQFRFRRQQQQQQRANGTPVVVAAAANANGTTRREWDGRIKLRASSLRQRNAKERVQRQAVAASVSTRQLREIATRRTKLVALNCRLEEELRKEAEKRLRAEGKCNGGNDAYTSTVDGKKNDGIRWHPFISEQKATLPPKHPTRKMVASRTTKADGSSEKKAPCTTVLTRRRQNEEPLACSPCSNVPYLHFITRKIERGEDQEKSSTPASDNDGRQEEEDRRSVQTTPPNVDNSPATLPDVTTNFPSPQAQPSPRARSLFDEKKGEDSATDDLATKVKQLEDRLKRLVGDHTHHVDVSEAIQSSSINKGESTGSDIGSVGASEGAANSKELIKCDHLENCGSTFDEGSMSQSPCCVHRPRPPVLPAAHTNVLLHPSHAAVPVADISSPAQEPEPIAFEAVVFGSLIDSIP